MFSGPIVWKGVVYSILMFAGKLATGLWLVRITLPEGPQFKQWPRRLWSRVQSRLCIAPTNVDGKDSNNQSSEATAKSSEKDKKSPPADDDTHSVNTTERTSKNPLSLYPPSIIGLAMVARGEIGYLIASLAESTGVFSTTNAEGSDEGSSETYLIVVWAITVCTIIGPVAVGALVRRVKRLQRDQETQNSQQDPLGSWGVS